MKKTDIAMIIFIASVSIMVSYFVTKSIMGDAVSKPVEVESAKKLSTEVKSPDEKIFNSNAINPTVEVTIGGNQTPATPDTEPSSNQQQSSTTNNQQTP